jgi:phenylacetate-CoA ligase
MAAESPVSVAIRRLARSREEVRTALFGDRSRLPMIFQYNPLIHWFEVDDRSEVVATVSRLDLLAPRIRYNVHDEGGVARFARVSDTLRRLGYEIERLGEAPETRGPRGPLPWSDPIPLPFLWIYGRTDATVSVMGANIYPEDVEAVIYADRALAASLDSFQLAVVRDAAGTPRPAVILELAEGIEVDDAWRSGRAVGFRDGLEALNRDYRTSLAEFPDAMLPIVETHARGSGPFAGDASRIKQRRILLPDQGIAGT